MCKRIPGRHIQSGHRDHGKPLIAHEVQGSACEIVKLDGRDASALEHSAEILQGRDQIAHRLDGIGLKIASPDDAFFGNEVDQDQRPFGGRDDPRDNRPLQLEHDRSRSDSLECKWDQLHRMPPDPSRHKFRDGDHLVAFQALAVL